MSLSQITPPATEPITLEQAKARLRLSDDTQNSRLVHLIRTARQRIEYESGRAIFNQTWVERRDSWQAQRGQKCRLAAFATQFTLVKPPLVSIERIEVFDADNFGTLWDPSQYFIDTLADPGRIALGRNAQFPEPGRAIAGIEIEFVCGYGTAVDDVPAGLIEASGLLMQAMFESEDEAVTLPLRVQSLIAPWRRLSL
ncbi:MAG: hypothetical protein P8P99_15775 [Maricaulis sp.]|nr:hypothetical protein [Maricaulis sp.]